MLKHLHPECKEDFLQIMCLFITVPKDVRQRYSKTLLKLD